MIAVSLVGGVLVAMVLRDVFHTLWHPAGHGSLSRTVMRLVWRTYRRCAGGRLMGLAGPSAMVAVMGAWVGTAVLAWTLVY